MRPRPRDLEGRGGLQDEIVPTPVCRDLQADRQAVIRPAGRDGDRGESPVADRFRQPLVVQVRMREGYPADLFRVARLSRVTESGRRGGRPDEQIMLGEDIREGGVDAGAGRGDRSGEVQGRSLQRLRNERIVSPMRLPSA